MIILIFLVILYIFIGIIFVYICNEHSIVDEDTVALILIFWLFVLLFMIIFNTLTSVIKKFTSRR
jgi:hypothetical protein